MRALKLRNNELAGHCAATDGQLTEVFDRLTNSEFEFVEAVLSEVLLISQAESGGVEVEAVEGSKENSLKSVFQLHDQHGNSSMVISFAIHDASIASALPVMGLIAAICAGSDLLKNALAAAGVLKSLWPHIAVLKRPGDNNAIDALEALLREQAKLRTLTEHLHPTADDVAREASQPIDWAIGALGVLNSRSVAKVVHWGDQVGDLKHRQNRWSLRF